MMRIIRALRALEDHWLRGNAWSCGSIRPGDLIGAPCLFAALWLRLIAAAVLR